MEEMLRHMNEIYKVILKLKDKLQDQILNLHYPNMLRDTIQHTKLLEIEIAGHMTRSKFRSTTCLLSMKEPKTVNEAL